MISQDIPSDVPPYPKNMPGSKLKIRPATLSSAWRSPGFVRRSFARPTAGKPEKPVGIGWLSLSFFRAWQLLYACSMNNGNYPLQLQKNICSGTFYYQFKRVFLVGGFNPFEKYESQLGWLYIPNWMENHESHVPNHQSMFVGHWSKTIRSCTAASPTCCCWFCSIWSVEDGPAAASPVASDP